MHSSTHARRRPLQLAATLAVGVFMLLAAPIAAQTPAAGSGTDSHPAHIHQGTCDELGEVVVPLTNVEAVPDAGNAVEVSQTAVDTPLQAIIDGGHAINVHLSDEEIGTYIACGEVGGATVVDPSGVTELFIALGELNDSGYAGVARLGIATDPNQTDVTVMLIETDKAP